LRYPYISTDPLDYTGSNSTSTTLAANASVGSQTIYLNNLSQSLTVGCVLYFQLANLLTNGSLNAISEIHTIISITTNPYNYEVTVGLDSPLTNNYLSGTVISVLNTTNNTTSIVIQPGQTILIPSNIQSSSFIKLNGSASSDPNIYLGQDLLLDISGNLSGDSTGDLSGVSGVANLTQALKNRLSTELGELVYYPQYGNVALDYIGSVSSSALAILCNSKVSSTLMQDPRVNSISNITTTVTGDILTINVSLVINSMSSGITLNFILNQ
jgi:phage baseplate assembly protein W